MVTDDPIIEAALTAIACLERGGAVGTTVLAALATVHGDSAAFLLRRRHSGLSPLSPSQRIRAIVQLQAVIERRGGAR